MTAWQKFLLTAHGFVGNTWQGVIWDGLPLLMFLICGWVVFRWGGRMEFGVQRARVGVVLLTLAAFLDVTDEFLGLSDMAVLGRMWPYHEGLESLLWVAGLGLFLSAVNSWMRYSD